jgi:hypothetical protein
MKLTEQLDSMLNLLASNPNNPYYLETDLLKKMITSKDPFKDMIDKQIILKKLCADKYVAIQKWVSEAMSIDDKRIEQQTYYITFEGRVFMENGGYTGEQRRKTRKQRLESVQTWAIAIGTGFAGIYAVVEIIKAILYK